MSVSKAALLYVTADGVLQQLGYSQVGRVILGLARRGFRYKLLSLESPADLADAERVAELEQRFANEGIHWTRLPYDQGGTALAAASNLARLGASLRALNAKGDIAMVHARGYHSAMVSVAARRVLGVRYLFDARGRWIDERLLGRRWFTNPVVERGARAVERQLYQQAAAVVVLTRLHADDITVGDFGRYRGAPLRVIPTCADFSAFELERRKGSTDIRAIPPEVQRRLSGKLVLAFVGSTNAFYRYEESFALAKRILARRPDAHLLILSAQRLEFAELVRRHELDEQRVTITTASHEAMPEWLSRIDWAIQLLNGGVAKRGSMPTKLAEFLAAGVRPIHFGCNAEVSDWVERTGSGLVLTGLEDSELDRAATFVASSSSNLQLLETARARAATYFDLAAGLAAYEELLCELGLQKTR